ncbi:MFS transporter [Streptomyces stramineus]
MPGRSPSRQDMAAGDVSPGTAPRPGPLALFAVCLGFFMVLMDSSALNVALPAVREDLAGSLVGLEWLLNGYTITLAAFLLSGGAVSDRWGARRVFGVSLLGFVVTSAACAASPDLGSLVTARVLQGITAGGLLPASLAVIARLYPDSARRAKALTVWGGVSSLALVFGPVLGGVLTTTAGWRSVFLINVPIGLLAWWLTRRQVPPSATREAALDPAGQTLAVVVVGCGIGALIEGAHGAGPTPSPGCCWGSRSARARPSSRSNAVRRPRAAPGSARPATVRLRPGHRRAVPVRCLRRAVRPLATAAERLGSRRARRGAVLRTLRRAVGLRLLRPGPRGHPHRPASAVDRRCAGRRGRPAHCCRWAASPAGGSSSAAAPCSGSARD